MTRVSPARLAEMVRVFRNSIAESSVEIIGDDQDIDASVSDALRAVLAVPEPAPDGDVMVIRAAVSDDDTGHLIVFGDTAIADDDGSRSAMAKWFGGRVIAFATIRVPHPRVVEVEAEVTTEEQTDG